MTPALRTLLAAPTMPVVTKITNAQLIATRKDILKRVDAIQRVVHSGDDFARIAARVTKLTDDLAELVLDQLLPITEEEEE